MGSSAISSFGPQASAMAIVTRWRMPPDSSCGYWRSRRSGSGMPTDFEEQRTACALASSFEQAEVVPQRLGDLAADRITGLSEVIGSWNTIAISVPQSAPQLGRGGRPIELRPS